MKYTKIPLVRPTLSFEDWCNLQGLFVYAEERATRVPSMQWKAYFNKHVEVTRWSDTAGSVPVGYGSSPEDAVTVLATTILDKELSIQHGKTVVHTPKAWLSI